MFEGRDIMIDGWLLCVRLSVDNMGVLCLVLLLLCKISI